MLKIIYTREDLEKFHEGCPVGTAFCSEQSTNIFEHRYDPPRMWVKYPDGQEQIVEYRGPIGGETHEEYVRRQKTIDEEIDALIQQG